jgi:hypothetical protein
MLMIVPQHYQKYTNSLADRRRAGYSFVHDSPEEQLGMRLSGRTSPPHYQPFPVP